MFNSCQKQYDNEIEIEQTSKNRYLLTRINPKDLDSNSILSNKISDINKSIDKRTNNIYARYENIEFYLNMNEATYIESLDGSYHSYTFAIYNENYSFDINNIVLSLNADGTYDADLVTYSLTEDERNLIDSGVELDLLAKMSIEPFDIDQINTFGRGDVGSTCNELVYLGQEDCSCHEVHNANGCTHPNDLFEWQEVDCAGGGSGTNGNTGDPSGNPSGSNSGSTGGETTPNPKATSLTNPNGSINNSTNSFSIEGLDQLDTDLIYWENPNLSFPAQNLPSYSSFDTAYPKTNGGLMSASDVFALIGGDVLNLANLHGYTNACAARVSRALNYSGVNIPNITGKTFKGADNKYYFLGARNLYEWMKKTFGTPNYSLNQIQAGIDGSGFMSTTNGDKGLYIMIPNFPAQFGASGHADIFNGTAFNSSGYFGASGGVHSANLWTLN